MQEQYFSAKEVMKMLSIKAYRTLKRLEEMRVLVPLRTPLGKMLYSKSSIDKYINVYCTYNDPDKDLIDNSEEEDDLFE